MQKFSFKRYLKALCWYLQYNRNRLLMWTLGSALCVFAGQLFMAWIMLSSDTVSAAFQYHHFVYNTTFFFAILLVLISLIGFASLFERILKKQRAAAFLMLPASNAEKYAVLMTYVTVVWPLCVFLAIAMGDTLRMLTEPLLKEVGYVSCVPRMIEFLTPDVFTGRNGFSLVAFIFTVVALVWVHSMYIAGGSVFRKHAFVIVTVAQGVLISAVVYLLHLLFPRLTLMSNINGEVSVNPCLWLITLILAAWAFYNYRLSYRVFKKLQVINHQLTNL